MREPSPVRSVEQDLPPVSILIAARNEESTILDCLRAIDALDYPKDRLQILIGNDSSTDRTAEVVNAFIQDKLAYRLITISQKRPNLNGKANVLAQLAHEATGEFLFTTDADARVSPTWLRAMLRQINRVRSGKPVGVCNGYTTILGDSIWARVLAVEYLLVFQLIALAAERNIPLTGLGNNMAIRREAYEAVGGFEGLPFSVVEDYTMFQAIVRNDYAFSHRLDPETRVDTLSPPTLMAYLQQRKRWMRGMFDLPFMMVLTTLIQYLLGPLLLVLAIWQPGLALSLYAIKVLGQTLLISNALTRLRQTHLWTSALFYEPYQALFGLLAFVYYWLPTGLIWKGRQY